MRTQGRIRVDKKQPINTLTAERRAAGRPPGCLNKTTIEVREICTKLLDPLYRKRLRQRLLDGTAGQIELLCWYYAYGKPRETIDAKITTEHHDHYHVYMPDNGRVPTIINGTTEELPNGHAGLYLPANGRSGTD